MRELVERAQRGDHEAFSRLLVASADRLYATAYLMMRDRTAAEDVVQEASIKAWRDLPGLRDPGRYDAWVRRLLVHTCLDHLRRRRRRPVEVGLVPLDQTGAPDASGVVADADELERAFVRLSPEHRAVIVLSHFHELSMTEVATTLEIPIGTAKSRLHHALRAMRAAIDADARLPTGHGGQRT